MQSRTLSENISALAMEAQSNPVAFGRLYDHYVQPVYRYLYSHVESVHEAEDLTSQTFISAYEALHKYRERGQFAAWLFQIARSRMNDHFRRSRREVDLEAVERVVEMDDTLDRVIRAEELIRLRSLIRELDSDEQELIRLRYVADLSFAEIAEVLGKREEAVKKWLYRLQARLKDQME